MPSEVEEKIKVGILESRMQILEKKVDNGFSEVFKKLDTLAGCVGNVNEKYATKDEVEKQVNELKKNRIVEIIVTVLITATFTALIYNFFSK